MKFLIFILFTVFLMQNSFSGEVTNKGQSVSYNGITTPANIYASGTTSFRTLHAKCNGVGQTTFKYRGQDYRTPSTKTLRVTGVFIDSSLIGANTGFKFGYHSTPVQAAQAFDSGTGAVWPTSGPTVGDLDVALASNTFRNWPLTGAEWIVPSSQYLLCFINVAGGSMVTLHGIEE